MQFINNAFEVTARSAVTWLGQILGYLSIFYGYVQTANPHIQETLHFTAWQDWVPFIVGLGAAFGIPLVRAISQPKVTAAANKP